MQSPGFVIHQTSPCAFDPAPLPGNSQCSGSKGHGCLQAVEMSCLGCTGEPPGRPESEHLNNSQVLPGEVYIPHFLHVPDGVLPGAWGVMGALFVAWSVLSRGGMGGWGGLLQQRLGHAPASIHTGLRRGQVHMISPTTHQGSCAAI